MTQLTKPRHHSLLFELVKRHHRLSNPDHDRSSASFFDVLERPLTMPFLCRIDEFYFVIDELLHQRLNFQEMRTVGYVIRDHPGEFLSHGKNVFLCRAKGAKIGALERQHISAKIRFEIDNQPHVLGSRFLYQV